MMWKKWSFRVNRKLLIYKAHYGFWHGALACIVPFLPLIVRDFGVPADVSGVIYTILPFIGLIARPLVSILADKFNKQKLVLSVSVTIVMVLLFSLHFIPPIISPDAETFALNCTENSWEIQKCPIAFSNNSEKTTEISHCLDYCTAINSNATKKSCMQKLGYSIDNHSETDTIYTFFLHNPINETYVNSCVNYLFEFPKDDDSESCFTMNCNQSASTKCFKECFPKAQTNVNIYKSYQFWWLALVVIIKGINMEMVTCVSDAITYNFLGEKKGDYGKQRVAGTIFWGGMALITGYLIDNTTVDGKSNYSLAFYLFFGFMIIDCISVFYLEIIPQKKPDKVLSQAWQSVKNMRGLIFLTAVFCMGTMVGIMETFLFWFIEDLGGTKLLMGAVRSMECFGGEMLFIIISGFIIKKMGHFNAISLAFLAYGVRYIIYSFLENPWYMLPVELLHGICFGVFWPAATSYASILAPQGLSTTLQGLVSAIYTGAGTGVGSFVAGILYEHYGGRITFRIFGVFSIGCCILHCIITVFLKKPKEEEKKTQSSKNQADTEVTTFSEEKEKTEKKITNAEEKPELP